MRFYTPPCSRQRGDALDEQLLETRGVDRDRDRHRRLADGRARLRHEASVENGRAVRRVARGRDDDAQPLARVRVQARFERGGDDVRVVQRRARGDARDLGVLAELRPPILRDSLPRVLTLFCSQRKLLGVCIFRLFCLTLL